MYRFIPLLAAGKGFEVTEIPVVHEKRKYGKSKYGFSKIFKDVPDMLNSLKKQEPSHPKESYCTESPVSGI